MADDQLLHYYERELTFLRRMGARVRPAIPEGRVAARSRAEQVRGSARRADARGVRVSRRARAQAHRRRRSRDQRGAAQDRLPALRAADSVDVARGVRARSRAGQADVRATGSARHAALLATRRRRAVQVQHVLRHHALAGARRGAQWTTPDRLKPPMRVDDAVAALRLELRCFTDLEFTTLDLDVAAPPPGRRPSIDVRAVRAAEQQLRVDHRARSRARARRR